MSQQYYRSHAMGYSGGSGYVSGHGGSGGSWNSPSHSGGKITTDRRHSGSNDGEENTFEKVFKKIKNLFGFGAAQNAYDDILGGGGLSGTLILVGAGALVGIILAK